MKVTPEEWDARFAGPFAALGNSLPRAGEIRAAMDMDLRFEKARLVLVLAAHRYPMAWAQVLLLDPEWTASSPMDLDVLEGMSNMSFPFLAQTDVTGPVYAAQLGPALGRVRSDVLAVLKRVAETGERPEGALPLFGSPWNTAQALGAPPEPADVDPERSEPTAGIDPRARWKQEQVRAIQELSSDALRAILEDDIAYVPGQRFFEAMASEGSLLSESLIAMWELPNLTVPPARIGEMLEAAANLSKDQVDAIRPLLESALRVREAPKPDLSRGSGERGSDDLPGTSLDDVAEALALRPTTRAVVVLSEGWDRDRVTILSTDGGLRSKSRVQVSGGIPRELVEETV